MLNKYTVAMRILMVYLKKQLLVRVYQDDKFIQLKKQRNFKIETWGAMAVKTSNFLIFTFLLVFFIGCARDSETSHTADGEAAPYSTVCNNGSLRCPELYEFSLLKISADSIMPELIEDKSAQEKFSLASFESNLKSYFIDTLAREMELALTQLIEGRSFKKFSRQQTLHLSKIYVVERDRDSLRTKLDGDGRVGGTKEASGNSLLARLRILGVTSNFNIEAIFLNNETGESYTMLVGELPVNVTLRQIGGSAKVSLGELVGSVLKVPALAKIIEDYILNVSLGASVEIGSLKVYSDAEDMGQTYIFNRGSERQTERGFSRMAEKLATAFARDICEPFTGDICDLKQDTTEQISTSIIEKIKIIGISKCVEAADAGGRYLYVKAPKVLMPNDPLTVYSRVEGSVTGYRKLKGNAKVEGSVTMAVQESCGSELASNESCYRVLLSNPGFLSSDPKITCSVVNNGHLVLSPLTDDLIQ